MLFVAIRTIMLSVIKLNVVLLNVIKLNEVKLSVILLNVTAPLLQLFDGKKLIKCWIEKNVSCLYNKTFYLYQDTQRRHLWPVL